jgi:hypothetical protein
MQQELFSIRLIFTVILPAVLCAAGLLWFVPRWQVRNIVDLTPKDRFDKENEPGGAGAAAAAAALASAAAAARFPSPFTISETPS